MPNRKDPHYKKVRRKVNAWISFAQALAAATKDEEDDEWAAFFADLVNEHFDEGYDIHWPANESPKRKANRR